MSEKKQFETILAGKKYRLNGQSNEAQMTQISQQFNQKLDEIMKQTGLNQNDALVLLGFTSLFEQEQQSNEIQQLKAQVERLLNGLEDAKKTFLEQKSEQDQNMIAKAKQESANQSLHLFETKE